MLRSPDDVSHEASPTLTFSFRMRAAFNARVMNQALAVQSVVLLMEIVRNAGMHERRAPTWIFLKILNY